MVADEKMSFFEYAPVGVKNEEERELRNKSMRRF